MPAFACTPLLTFTVTAAAVVAADRFITGAGLVPAAGGLPVGVTRCSGTSGDRIPVDALGTAIVTAGAAIALDAVIAVGTDGKAVTHDGDGDKYAVGRARTAATGDGDTLEVWLLIPAGVLPTAA